MTPDLVDRRHTTLYRKDTGVRRGSITDSGVQRPLATDPVRVPTYCHSAHRKPALREKLTRSLSRQAGSKGARCSDAVFASRVSPRTLTPLPNRSPRGASGPALPPASWRPSAIPPPEGNGTDPYPSPSMTASRPEGLLATNKGQAPARLHRPGDTQVTPAPKGAGIPVHRPELARAVDKAVRPPVPPAPVPRGLCGAASGQRPGAVIQMTHPKPPSGKKKALRHENFLGITC